MPHSHLWLSLIFGATLASAALADAERFICAARVDCGATTLPSTQDLPTNETPSVRSRTATEAREKCGRTYRASYDRLLQSVDPVSAESVLREARGCRVSAEALKP